MTTVDRSWDLLPTTSQFEAANVTLRVGGVALAGNRITTIPGVFREVDYLDRVRLGEGSWRRSHWIILQSDLSDGLVRMSHWSLLWTTNMILWIRTAVRRFLTKAVGAFVAAEDSRFVATFPIYAGSARRKLARYWTGSRQHKC